LSKLVCPTCNQRLKHENENLICNSCKSKFTKIGRTVYINEQALEKARRITQETDERLVKIIEKIGVNNLSGNEGEVVGVIEGRKFGRLIFINDFVVTGSAGEHVFDPILAIDEKKESSEVFRCLRRYILEKRLEIPLSLLSNGELEEIREHCSFKQELFYSEIKRLIEEGENVKIGTFHSHEIEARRISNPDRRFIALGEDAELGDGKNSSVQILISGTLMVHEYGSVEELGKISLIGYDWDEIDEMLSEYYEDIETL